MSVIKYYVTKRFKHQDNVYFQTQSRRISMLADTINKENIHQMVVKFYSVVLKDETVGPFFIEKLGDKLSTFLWQEHIKLLTNFWASIALGDTEYRGNPFGPHTRLQGLKRETFDQWLILFFGVLDEIYTPEVAAQFKERSTIIAGNFMRNLQL